MSEVEKPYLEFRLTRVRSCQYLLTCIFYSPLQVADMDCQRISPIALNIATTVEFPVHLMQTGVMAV